MNIPSFYQVLVFLHVLGGMGIFVALGIEALALGRLRQANTPAGVRMSMGLLAAPRRLGPIAMLVTLAAGIWMMAVLWGPEPWIQASFAGLVVAAVLGGLVSRRGVRRLGMALQAETGTELSATALALRSSPGLLVPFWVRGAIGVGILALMTMKPGALGSWLLMGGAVATGLFGGLWASRPQSRDGRDDFIRSRPGSALREVSGARLQEERA